jgi:RNA polymerase sigma factor (sigma-70 family)
MSEIAATDLQLLARYTQDRAEDAFAELVRRHVDLVHSAALRQVRSPQLAEEVAQSVFADLAQAGTKLKPDTILTAWLYQVTRRTAIEVVRREARRQLREQIATEMNALNASGTGCQPVWSDLEPLLDEAMSRLDENDRAAVLLRYFENQSLRDVGRQLGMSDDAAQKRVSRAVERLREFFAKHRVNIGASGMASLLSANAVQAAPAGLAVTISTAAALAGASTVTSSTVITLTKAIAMTTVQKILVTATVAILAGAGIYEARQASTLRGQVQAVQQQQAPLAEKVEQLSREREDATRQLAALRDENERLNRNTPELLRLRGMAGVAHLANVEAAQLRAQLARQTGESSTNLVTGAMADAMKQAMEQQVEGRLSRMVASLRLNPEQTQAARDILTQQSKSMSTGMQQAFSGNLDKEELTRLGQESGKQEAQIKALLTQDQQAAYQNYQHEEIAYNARLTVNAELLQLHALDLTRDQQDRAFAALYDVTMNQFMGSAKLPLTNQSEAILWVLDQKAKALEPVLTPAQFKSYTQQQAIQAKLIQDMANKMEAGGSK